jgi:phosphatidylglycerol:prolipoprotein diacylglycerol transferase
VLPYFPQPFWTIGPITIHAFGLCVAASLVIGHWMLARRARQFSLHSGEVSLYYLFLLLGGAAGLGFQYWFVTPGLGSLSVALGAAAGGAACSVARPYCRAHFRRYLDVTAFAVPFAAIAARTGCTLAHDHPGAASTSWLAIRFPDGPRYDLGFLELLFSIACAGLFSILDRRKRRPLFFLTVGVVLYASWRLFRRSLEM